MADLTSSDVTVTLTQYDRDFFGRCRVTFPTVAFGNSSKTIPTGGLIPLPDKSYFGMKREIKAMIPLGSGASGYVFEYVEASHSLKVFYADYNGEADGPLIAAAAVAIAATTLPLMVIGE